MTLAYNAFGLCFDPDACALRSSKPTSISRGRNGHIRLAIHSDFGAKRLAISLAVQNVVVGRKHGKLDAAFYCYSGLPWAADVPAADGPPLSIHSNPAAIMAPMIGPAM